MLSGFLVKAHEPISTTYCATGPPPEMVPGPRSPGPHQMCHKLKQKETDIVTVCAR